jgi:hypothetical protein
LATRACRCWSQSTNAASLTQPRPSPEYISSRNRSPGRMQTGVFRHPRWSDVLDTGGAGGQRPGQRVCTPSTFWMPCAKSGRPIADKGRRVEKVSCAHPRRAAASRQSAGLTTRPLSALILGWGALDEGENEASNMGFDGRGTPQKKFYWRPVAPT